MPFSVPRATHEHSSNYRSLALKSEYCHLQSCPPANVEMSSVTRVRGCGVQQNKLHFGMPVERPPKLSQLPSERFFSVEQRGYSNAQVPRPIGPIRYAQSIVASYLSFRGTLMGLHQRQQEFVNCLHFKLCMVQICKCKAYLRWISHFDGCQQIDCTFCQPVREWFYSKKNSSEPTFQPRPIKKLISESGKPKQFVSGDLCARDNIVQDMQPTPKRMKMENATDSDGWSLFSVILPKLEQCAGGQMNGEGYQDKTNKEPMCSNEAPTAAKSWNANASADNGGSMWPRRSDGLLGIGQSPECNINPAPLSEAPKSIGNLGNNLRTFSDPLDFNHMKLEKDDAVSNSEGNLMIIEQQGVNCIKTKEVKTGLTFGCQSSHTEDTCFRSQVGNIGESLRISGQDLDPDNMKLGKDAATCHSIEQNVVNELQEIDFVKTSKGKSDVISGCQDLNSSNIFVLPQVSDLGKSLGTHNDACNLDDISLGKVDAISHSEDINMVDEQQEIGGDKTNLKSDVTSSSQSLNSDGICVPPQDMPIDGENCELMSQVKCEGKDANYVLPNPDNQCGGELDDLKASGVSLIDFFTAEQITEHLCSLNPAINLVCTKSFVYIASFFML